MARKDDWRTGGDVEAARVIGGRWTAMGHRFSVAVLVALATAGCQFGLDYSGDETGLRRTTLTSPGPHADELSYLIHGDATKPRVLFVHGSPGHSSMYAGYLRELADEAEVVAVDRLGYGASQGSGPVVEFERQAAALAPLLVQREGRWPIVVGHSLGGPIAARLAADNPGRVGALVIVAGGLNAELEETRWYNDVARWWIVSPFLADFLKTSNEEMWACREQVELLDPLLDEISCPVIVIHGTEDSLVPFEQIEYTIERMAENPSVYVMVLIGEDHGVTKLRREEVRETIQEILAGFTDFVEEDL